MNQHPLHLIGYASGEAGVDVRCGDGPLTIQAALPPEKYTWNAMLKSRESLAAHVSQALQNSERIVVIGGDHSCAIGTWSGVYDAMQTKGDIGLIWIDAHMDSHTPETTLSGRLHGMPLACLLGFGDPLLTHLLHAAPKFKPENVCLIGVRSYEAGEAALLRQLNIKVYFMEEVKQRGFAVVWDEAREYVNRHTVGYGISLDLDGIDPRDAPGVDVPEPDGIPAAEVCQVFSRVAADPSLVLTEIVEFDPSRDYDRKTEKLVISLIEIMTDNRKQE